jgi:hypothetical protein
VVSIKKIQPLSISLSAEIESVLPELKKKVIELAREEVHKISTQTKVNY